MVVEAEIICILAYNFVYNIVSVTTEIFISVSISIYACFVLAFTDLVIVICTASCLA